MAFKNKSKRPLPKKDIKQPTIPIPSVGYVGQDLGSLLPNNQNKVDMNWLDQVGSNQPVSSTGFAGGGSVSTSKNKNGLTMDSDWSDILKNLGQGTDFAQFLSKLGIGGTDPYDQSMHDLNQKIIEQILQHYVTQEQRGYDRALQQDQRLYDSPTNVLARLMGAGISRDAAIQMLNGSGSGSGSAVPYGQIGDNVEMESASQAYANQMAGATAVANSVFNGIGALVGLTNLGLSVPQAVSQIGIMRNQQFLSNQQRAAYDSASAAFNILATSGVEYAADTFGSVRSVLDAISQLASDGNGAAQAFLSNGGAKSLIETSPYSSPMIAQLYKSERESSDHSALFTQNVRHMEAENELLGVQKTKMQQEVQNLQQEYENLVATEDYIQAETNLAKATEKLRLQEAKTQASVRYELRTRAKLNQQKALESRELTRQLNLDNSQTSALLNAHTGDGKTGLQWLTDYRLNELMNGCRELSQLRSSGAISKKIEEICANYDNSIALYTLSSMYANGTIDYLSNQGADMSNLLSFCRAAQDMGLFKYVETLANEGEVRGLSFGFKGNVPRMHTITNSLKGNGDDNAVRFTDPRKNRGKR